MIVTAAAPIDTTEMKYWTHRKYPPGHLQLGYAQPIERYKLAKTNKTNYVTYKLEHGMVDGESHGINWNAVKSVSGQTYGIKEQLKKMGYRWNRDQQRWEK